MTNFKTYIDRVDVATQANQHTEALKIIAEYLQDREMIKQLNAVDTLHTFYGHLPNELRTIRAQLSDRLFNKLTTKEKEQFSNVL